MKEWSILVVTDLHYELPDANFVDDPKELAPDHWAFRDSVFTDFHVLLEGHEGGGPETAVRVRAGTAVCGRELSASVSPTARWPGSGYPSTRLHF